MFLPCLCIPIAFMVIFWGVIIHLLRKSTKRRIVNPDRVPNSTQSYKSSYSESDSSSFNYDGADLGREAFFRDKRMEQEEYVRERESEQRQRDYDNWQEQKEQQAEREEANYRAHEEYEKYWEDKKEQEERDREYWEEKNNNRYED